MTLLKRIGCSMKGHKYIDKEVPTEKSLHALSVAIMLNFKELPKLEFDTTLECEICGKRK